jgi:uncharacterized protein YqhQ
MWENAYMIKKEKIDFAVGGQAVIEGVMMRSPNFYVVSVRDEEGKIHMQEKSFVSIVTRLRLSKIPIVRGVFHFVESWALGFKALNFSNDIFLGNHKTVAEDQAFWKRILWSIFSVLYFVFTLSLTIFLLKVLPLWVAERVSDIWLLAEENYILFNAIDGLTKITIFLSYIIAISLMKDIQRVFQYHGAEHKSIWAYDKGLELTVENAQKQTRFHPRCGTSFLVIVILMSILIYTLIPPADGFWFKLLQRLAVVPVIAGASYEVLKLSAGYPDHFWAKAMAWPGLLIQRLTTREPDDEQVEIALHSLKAALKHEKA